MINKELLQEMIDKKYVNVQKHPYADLYIYNYSKTCQFEKAWNEVTLQTRGLILDKDFNIAARPFKKFFNLEELNLTDIPNEKFKVFPKLDGSLGILYWIDDYPFIATRGSFVSEQAKVGTEILYNKYCHMFHKFDKSKTYLFEIIYQENRVVIDYHAAKEIVLIAIVDNETGKELLNQQYYDEALRLSINSVLDVTESLELSTKLNFDLMKNLNTKNEEGFVIVYNNGFRMKIKFEEYKRLHRILTGVSNIAIWEYLSENKSFDELLEAVPDEFFDWLIKTKENLIDSYNMIKFKCIVSLLSCELITITGNKTVLHKKEDRKEIANFFKNEKYKHIIFSMLDNKNYSKIIWQEIRPQFSKPFSKNNDEIF